MTAKSGMAAGRQAQRNRAKWSGAAVVALTFGAVSAYAQTTPPAAPVAPPASTSAPQTTDKPKPAQTDTSATQNQAGKGASSETDAAPADDTTTVTVVAKKPEIEHKVDRDVYDVKQDPTSATGAAADVLNNIPAVTVDSDGTVSLRGNSNVQIYVNGKKSSQMQGDNRAFTLQSLSGDDIDSVEVMTNPSAAYGSDTAGGIINIVMKRGRAIKPQTSYNVSVGDQGRANVGFRTGKTWDKFTLNANVNLNQGAGGSGGAGQGRSGGGGGRGGSGPKTTSISDRIRLDPTTGAVSREDVARSVSKSDNRSMSATLNGNYNLTENDTLEGNLDYRRNESTGISNRDVKSYDGTHNLIQDYGSIGNSERDAENLNFSLTYDHRGEIGTTEDFKMSYQHSENLSNSSSHTQNIYHQSVGPILAPETFTAQQRKSKDFVDEFSGDWSHPIGNSEKVQSQLQLGWSFQNTVSEQFSYQSQTMSQPVVAPASPRSNGVRQFNDSELLSAGYATWQQQWGKFGYQVGLRVENLHQELESQNLVPAGHPGTPDPVSKNDHDSIVYSPSLFVTYNLTDIDHLKFIYSQKVRRPGATQINPFIVYSEDLLSASSGNANLVPEKTDKYELAYNRDVKGGNLSGNLYYNSTTGFINSVQSYIASPITGGAPVLLSSYENSGSSKQTGVSINYGSGFFDQKLRINVGGDYSNTVTDGFDFITHAPLHTSEPNSSARAMVRYQANQKDSYVVNLQYNGRRGDTQGHTTASQAATFSYVHQIIPAKMALTVNASNFIFGPLSKRVTNTSVTQGYSQTFNPGASFTVSLRYTFGAVRQGRGSGPRDPNAGPRGGGNWRGGGNGGNNGG